MGELSTYGRLVGATLGNYRLERLVEESEAGCVFVARTNAAAALFRLRILAVTPDLTPEDRIVYFGRLQQEANRVASLQHTHVLALVDYGTQNVVPAGNQGQDEARRGQGEGVRREIEQGQVPYLVSPYFPMRSLSAQLAQKGPMDMMIASRYLDQITAALEYAHQQAILHRNLSPDCIFIKQDGDLLVADFGVMHMLDIGAGFIAPGASKGTYGMNEASAPAPEQIRGQLADTYTDVYALGAVLYRMLTGHRVFGGKTREEIFQQHLQAPVPSLATWRSDLPRELDTIIARAMAKEPAQRFRQPGELANAYHAVVASNDTKRVPFFIPASPVQVTSKASKDGNGRESSRPNMMGDQSKQARISRRRALSLIGAGGGVAAAIVAVAVFGSRYLAGNTSPANTASLPASTPAGNATSPSSNGQGAHVLARTSDIPLNSAKTFPISGKSNPGVLIHLPDGRFVAFDSTCTHAGCPVDYVSQDKILKCPCHSAIFDPARNAAVVQGPAKTPLAPIAITVNANGTITQR
jgi:serine/threonine protein kinase